MEFAYEKLMEKEGMTMADLNDEAKTGIDQLNQIKKAIHMTEKQGRKIKPAVMAKVKTFDGWVVREIMDIIEEKNTNTAAPSVNAQEIVKEIKTEATPATAGTEKPVEAGKEAKPDPRGVKIEAELSEAHKNGKASMTLEQVREACPEAYEVIFNSYTEGEQNGVETSKYSLIESEKHTFTLTKK